MASHMILGDKVRVYRRPNSSLWQCSTYLEGKEWRFSTKTDSLSLAKEFVEDWYLELRGKSRSGQLKTERTFADAAKHFIVEYVAITNGERHPRYVKDHEAICLRLLEGADIYKIAKNSCTSVEMIEKHYAVRLKNTLDAKAINVRKASKVKVAAKVDWRRIMQNSSVLERFLI